MKILFLFLFALALSIEFGYAQFDYPYAVQGPEGIYVMCGNKIPKDFVYKIYRTNEGKEEWTMIKVLSFKPNYDDFFQNLLKFVDIP